METGRFEVGMVGSADGFAVSKTARPQDVR
jgi:hypothetical protein